MANESGIADRYLGYSTKSVWNDPNLTKYSGLKPMDQASYMTPEARKSFTNDLYKRLKGSNYKYTYNNPAGELLGGAPQTYDAEKIFGILSRSMEGRQTGSDVKDLEIFKNAVSKDPAFQRQLKESYTYFPAFYNALKSGNMGAYDKFVSQKALEGMSPTQRMAITGTGIAQPVANAPQQKGVPMYTNPAGPYLPNSGQSVVQSSASASSGTIPSGSKMPVGTGVTFGGATGFDADKSRAEAARKLKAESDAEFAARLAEERALFNQRISPLERQMAGMPEQLAAKEFQSMRQAFQNLANRGMLNSGQNWLAQNEAARVSNESLGAAQQAYLEKVAGLQDQFRATSQNLLDKQATRDLPYFVEQLRRQEAAKLDEIEKIRLQNEGKIAVANINAASRSQVAGIRARASAVAKASSPSGAPSDVSKDYLTILQRAGKTEADYYYKRYKTAAESFYTYSKNAKQDPNVLQGLYNDFMSAQKDMNDRALVTNTGVTSIAARPFIPQQ